jgi:hypothetical protein
MAKRNVFQFELDTDLSDAFLHAAKSARREPEELIAALVPRLRRSAERGSRLRRFREEEGRSRTEIRGGRPGTAGTEVDAVFEDMRMAIQKAGR